MRQVRITRSVAGTTLIEMLIVLTILGTVTAVSASAMRNFREASSIRAASWSVRNHMAMARSLAIARREKIRLRMDSTGDLVVLSPSGERLAAATVGPAGDLPIDSLRVRPTTLRFNSRGHAAPGSIYLYRGDRIVRIVSNFLGRLRVESYRQP